MNGIATFLRESGTARFFIPLGLILIIFGVAVFIINGKNQNYIETEATVSNVELIEEEYTDSEGNTVDATYNVTIKYTVEGKEYEDQFEGTTEYKVGEKTKIYYNPDDPSKTTQTKSMVLPVVMVIGGIVSLVGGIVSAVNAVKKHKALKIQEEGWKNE